MRCTGSVDPGCRCEELRAMLLSCGDALIDFLPVRSVDGRDASVPVAGGSCLNIAVGMARLGASAGVVGGLSAGFFGRKISDPGLGPPGDLRYCTAGAPPTTLPLLPTVGGGAPYSFYCEANASPQL